MEILYIIFTILFIPYAAMAALKINIHPKEWHPAAKILFFAVGFISTVGFFVLSVIGPWLL